MTTSQESTKTKGEHNENEITGYSSGDDSGLTLSPNLLPDHEQALVCFAFV